MVKLVDAMKKAVDDSDLHDVTLVTKDGKGVIREIPTSRYVLSIRSPVFKTMLFGNFKEASTDRIEISDEFSYSTMKSFVHFLHTDEFQHFGDSDDASNGVRQMTINLSIDLFNAGHYYEVDEIMQRITPKWFYWKKVALPTVYSNKKFQNSLFYAAAHVADPENEGKSIYGALQDHLKAIFCLGGVAFEELVEFRCISPCLISRVFNNNTVAQIDDDKHSVWLKALNVWGSQSEEHASAAQDILKEIEKEHFDARIFAELYNTGTSFLSKETALDILLKLALSNTQET